MAEDDNVSSPNILKICFNCVGETYLSEEIRDRGSQGTCDYCGSQANQYSLEDLSERIETAFDQHYIQTSDQPEGYECAMLADKESDYDWERNGDPIVDAIMNAAVIPEEAASHIQGILEEKNYDHDDACFGDETKFSSDSYYEENETNDGHWWNKWRGFEHALKTETRFFSQSASQLLTTIFQDIDNQQTGDGRPMIADAGPGTKYESVFRARSFQADDDLKTAISRPDIHLGAPPSEKATSGRMNSHGISVFYCSNDPEVAIAEIRPPVGCRVVVARFEIVRPIRLLDLTALEDVVTKGSVFDPKFIDILERTKFLQNLSRLITMPVMPNDVDLEYLSTQAIADFLASINVPSIDGIVFPSVQTNDEMLNFVFFHKAARVKKIDLPIGTEICSSLGLMSDDGWEDYYSVSEEIPSKRGEDVKETFLESQPPVDSKAVVYTSELDQRLPTLTIDLDSVSVYTVEAVKYRTRKQVVNRHRSEKYDRDFPVF